MLPYKSIDEAESALGRALTFAETLWFNYSANKSNYFLFCHNILFLFAVFTLAPIPMVVVDMLRSRNIDKYKIQPKVKLSFAEMMKCYKDVMVMFFLVIGPLQLVSYPSIKLVGIRTGLPLPSGWEILAQLLVYFTIEDYSNYWMHRFLHGNWGYKNIHFVHHEYTAPMAYAAPYAHWAEVLILGIPSFLGPAIAPGHMITFWLWIFLRQIEAIDTHSGCANLVPRGFKVAYALHQWYWHSNKMQLILLFFVYDFPWSFTKYIPFYGGAEHHDYHHYVGGQSQSNFASVFTYCDYIYGTDKGYRYQKKILQKMKEEQKNGSMQKTD